MIVVLAQSVLLGLARIVRKEESVWYVECVLLCGEVMFTYVIFMESGLFGNLLSYSGYFCFFSMIPVGVM